MIRSLHIEHYALIDHLDIDFHPGFSVITGETGAGKSIILGATQLLLGGRADHSSIRQGETRCVIEAEFSVEGMNLDSFFEENDLDFDGTTCILRRELTAAGKSRAYVNDSPVALSAMKELGEHLIDIHSQHQNLLLGKEDYQMLMLDTIAGNAALLDQYALLYTNYKDLCKQLDGAQQALDASRAEEDYLRFQVSQLEDARLCQGEDTELIDEQKQLSHAEDIATNLYASANALDGDSDNGSSARGLIAQARQAVDSIVANYKPAEELSARLEACYIEISDIANELNSRAESVNYDPERLQQIDDRLNIIYDLERKHHCSSCDELIALQAELTSRLTLIDQSDEALTAIRQQCEQAEQELMACASRLSQQRAEATTLLEERMTTLLQTLGMPHATFATQITHLEKPTLHGLDKVTFLFSANKNISAQPLSQVASGGETARVMLALKALTSSMLHHSTIIFDEIDTGVSGHIAEKMACIMRDMARCGLQVVSITHLPQIAAMGEKHYRVYKNDELFQTTTNIKQLTQSERIDELAHMLSGATITQAALSNARELLGISSKTK